MRLASKHDPHVILLAAVAVAVALEAARGSGTLGTSETWPLLQAVVVGRFAAAQPGQPGREARRRTAARASRPRCRAPRRQAGMAGAAR